MTTSSWSPSPCCPLSSPGADPRIKEQPGCRVYPIALREATGAPAYVYREVFALSEHLARRGRRGCGRPHVAPATLPGPAYRLAPHWPAQY